MSDDREFSQYNNQSWVSKIPNPYITFREYVLSVVSDGHRRKDEFECLVKFFTLEEIDAIVEGKLTIGVTDILSKAIA